MNVTMRDGRNPRGEGWRLRADLIDAAGRLLEQGVSAEGLSIRAVARAAGVSAMAPYRHFDDRSALLLALYQNRFAELGDVLDAAATEAGDVPAAKLRSVCDAYVRYGRENYGPYRVLFGTGFLPTGPVLDDLVGRQLFDRLVALVSAAAVPGSRSAGDARRATVSLWCGLHGMVSLRQSKPAFEWPADSLMIDDQLEAHVGLRGRAEGAPS